MYPQDICRKEKIHTVLKDVVQSNIAVKRNLIS